MAVTIIAGATGNKKQPLFGSTTANTARPGPTAGLPAAPAYWPSELTLGVTDDIDSPAAITKKFGPGTLVLRLYGGDPIAAPLTPGAGIGTDVAKIAAAKAFPLLSYYSLPQIGFASKATNAIPTQERALIKDRRSMNAYWASVQEFLRELGATGIPIAVEVEPDSWSALEANTNQNDPGTILADVSGAGVAGVPATVAGVAQAWVKLRDKLAPKVMLGYVTEDWAVTDVIDKIHPSAADAAQLATAQASWYRKLGARFDFTVEDLSLRDFGHDRAVVPKREDYVATLTYVRAYVRQTGTRLLLGGVPVGNTLMLAMNNTRYHWRDNHVQYFLGDPGLANLRAFRDAGLIGIQFGADADAPDRTCACDAAKDGVTNPPPFFGHQIRSYSADDDGGYLARQLTTVYAPSARLRIK